MRLPSAVDIGASHIAVPADTVWGPRWLTFDIPAVSASSLNVVLTRDSGFWMMLGEVVFEDGSQIPEPATWLSGLAVLGLAAGRLRRR